MPRIQLLTSYRDKQKGEIIEMGHSKCEELISLGRAKYIQSYIQKEIFGEEKEISSYNNKQMASEDIEKPKKRKNYKTKVWQ